MYVRGAVECDGPRTKNSAIAMARQLLELRPSALREEIAQAIVATLSDGEHDHLIQFWRAEYVGNDPKTGSNRALRRRDRIQKRIEPRTLATRSDQKSIQPRTLATRLLKKPIRNQITARRSMPDKRSVSIPRRRSGNREQRERITQSRL